MTAHPSDDELEAYAGRSLPAAALLAVDDHLAECGSCRARIAAPAASARMLFARLEPSDHLDEETAAWLVDGTLDDVAREVAEGHLEGCGACRAEIASLRSSRDELRPSHTYAPARSLHAQPRSGVWLALAAVLALALLSSWLLLRPAPPQRVVEQPEASPAPRVSLLDGLHRITLGAGGEVQGLEAASPRLQQRVASMLASGRIEIATPSDLVAPRQQLMGPGAVDAGFGPLEPIGTVVASTQPTLRWTPLPGAWTYEVMVHDGAVIVRSPLLAVTEWTPPSPLPRGATCTWQVAATRNGERRLAPAPPQPEARFRVMDLATASAIEGEPSGSYLVRALLYADAGDADAARGQLQLLAERNPESAIARRLAASSVPYLPSPTSTNPAQ